MADKQFHVWLFRDRYWQAGGKGRKVAGPFAEPAEAADAAEMWLERQGLMNQSYCELRLNGDPKPHTVICYMPNHEFGIWNTEVSRWPIFYPESGSYLMLGDFPFQVEEDGNTWEEEKGADKKQKSEDEGNMKLDEVEDDGAEEEESESDDESEADSGDDGSDDSDEDETDADESGEGDDEDAEEDADADEEDEGESDSEDESDDDQESEVEMPRLGIFAKFRGPLGWRKRAEAEELKLKNIFALKLGVLDPEGEKPTQQEREVFAEMQFIESDEDREAGILKLRLPEGVEFSEPTKSGWISARIPYRQDA